MNRHSSTTRYGNFIKLLTRYIVLHSIPNKNQNLSRKKSKIIPVSTQIIAKHIEIFLNFIIKHFHFDFSCKFSNRISLFFTFNSVISFPNKSEVSPSLCFYFLPRIFETSSSFKTIHSNNPQSSLFQLCQLKKRCSGLDLVEEQLMKVWTPQEHFFIDLELDISNL